MPHRPPAQTRHDAPSSPGPRSRTGLPAFDALVLAGGRATRLGTPKPGLVVAGRPLLEHALAATSGARVTVVVGPDELTDATDGPARYLLTREDPPFGGPVAGIAAGLAALRTVAPDGNAAGLLDAATGSAATAAPDDAPAPWVLVLACDVPRAADAVPLLLAAAADTDATGEPVDAVHAVRDGRDQWLVGLYRRDALDAAVARLRAAGGVDSAPVHRLLGALTARTVEDAAGLTDDVDTWQDAHEHDRRAGTGRAADDRTPHGTPTDRRPR
ncbi:NTP transferase domain-containing protein [Cellulosimicrobium sp. PMB13]|uniref:molybdenum cofactor guanylyltransferase n=1 Tax=Cellulosimicrobium sp. PMB13 TaxID=3120158 RepID=UPI003F4C40B1